LANHFTTVEEYFASRSAEVQGLLGEIRSAVLAAVPDAGEKIAYGMPTVTMNGRTLMSYAAWASHIGVYPIPQGDAAFQADIAVYRDAKSTARFPLSEPVPVELIATMARFLAQERAA